MKVYYIELGDYDKVCKVIRVKESSIDKAIKRGYKLLKKHEGKIAQNQTDDLVQISIKKNNRRQIQWDYMNGRLS